MPGPVLGQVLGPVPGQVLGRVPGQSGGVGQPWLRGKPECAVFADAGLHRRSKRLRQSNARGACPRFLSDVGEAYDDLKPIRCCRASEGNPCSRRRYAGALIDIDGAPYPAKALAHAGDRQVSPMIAAEEFSHATA